MCTREPWFRNSRTTAAFTFADFYGVPASRAIFAFVRDEETQREKSVRCWLPEPNVDGARTRVLSRTKNGTLFRSRQRVTVVKGWQDQSAQKQRSYEVASTENGNKEQKVMEKWDIEKQKGKITLVGGLFHVQTLLSYFLSLKRDFSSKVCGRFSLIEKEQQAFNSSSSSSSRNNC